MAARAVLPLLDIRRIRVAVELQSQLWSALTCASHLKPEHEDHGADRR
jgi:hypothetical protein